MSGAVLQFGRVEKNGAEKNSNQRATMLASISRCKDYFEKLEQKFKENEKLELNDKNFAIYCKEPWDSFTSIIIEELSTKIDAIELPDNMEKAADLIIQDISKLKDDILLAMKENNSTVNQEISNALKYQTDAYQMYVFRLDEDQMYELDDLVYKKIKERWN